MAPDGESTASSVAPAKGMLLPQASVRWPLASLFAAGVLAPLAFGLWPLASGLWLLTFGRSLTFGLCWWPWPSGLCRVASGQG